MDDTIADQRRGAVCWGPQTPHGRNGFVWLLGRSLVVLIVVLNATRLELHTDASVSEDGDCTVGDHTNWRLVRGRPFLLRLAGSGLVTRSGPDTFPSATISSSSDIQPAAQASRFEHFPLRFHPTGSAICGSRRPTSRAHGLFGGGKRGGPDGGWQSAAILIAGPAVGILVWTQLNGGVLGGCGRSNTARPWSFWGGTDAGRQTGWADVFSVSLSAEHSGRRPNTRHVVLWRIGRTSGHLLASQVSLAALCLIVAALLNGTGRAIVRCDNCLLK